MNTHSLTMSNTDDPRPDYADNDEDDDDGVITEVREVRAVSSSHSSSSTSASSNRNRGRESWEITPRSSTLQSSSSSESENFPSLSREFSAMVVAGSNIPTSTATQGTDTAPNLGRIGEDELQEETNPLAIVPDSNPVPSPRRTSNSNIGASTSSLTDNSNRSTDGSAEEVSVHKVKKEEVESKISAWQTAEIAKINNRFKRQDVIISGWENEQVERSTARLKKIERKLEERRARAEERMQNDVAKARRKAEERRASAEAKRGMKVAKVLELSSLLRTVGRAPSKRSFF